MCNVHILHSETMQSSLLGSQFHRIHIFDTQSIGNPSDIKAININPVTCMAISNTGE